ncbi:helix-turn-helix domain-containing protein [Mucilaginibacter pocheonensis]|uniref:helix-turn-helix domain-containing protein n=1 Tax=Mucilaginibacter pocheonensis TaxID=398050 RepID=UPI0035B5308B
MYIKAAHLVDTLRAVTGFPVTYYIQQELMRRARPLLYQRDLSVNEIVAALGFEDAQ